VAIEITMSMRGVREFDKLLERAEKSGHDLSSPLSKSAFHMQDSVAKNFEQGGRPEKWKEWSAGYSAWRHRIGRPFGMLILDVSLRATRIGARGRVYGGNLRKGIHVPPPGKDMALVSAGKNAPYAKAHQFGYGPIPARPFMLFQDEDIEKIEKFFKDWLDGKVAR
jgi:phage gpG-like protein